MNSLNEMFLEKSRILSLKLELTNFCNLKCIHCYAREVNCRYIDKEKVFSILNQAKKMGVVFVHLTGGECLTHPDFMEIYTYAYELNFKIIILSNGTMFTTPIIKTLAEKRPYLVEISIYSTNEEVSEKITGIQTAYKRTFQSINIMKKYSINIFLKYILMNGNQECLMPFLCYVKKNGFSHKVYYNIMPTKNNDQWSDLHISSFVKEIINFYTIDNYVDKLICTSQNINLSCNASKSFINVDCDGCIYFCDFMRFIRVDAAELEAGVDRLRLDVENYKNTMKECQCHNCQNSSKCDICIAALCDEKKVSECCAEARYRESIFAQIRELEGI